MLVTPAPVTSELSFSFYIGGSDASQITNAATWADAVVVSGPAGPKTVEQLRNAEWNGAVLFDRAGYRTPDQAIAAARWLDLQQRAGADRLLMPGRYISRKSSKDDFRTTVETELMLAAEYGASALFAVDHHWLTKGLETTLTVLSGCGIPVALVLSHPSDPLSATGAVEGLTQLCKSTPNLTLLRADHGAIGGLAFNAIHASIGLQAVNRHLVPPGSTGGGKPNDGTPRLFSIDLMDWFTALTISDWTSSSFDLTSRGILSWPPRPHISTKASPYMRI